MPEVDAIAGSSGVDSSGGGCEGTDARFGHFGALATATSHFSSGPMSASRASSSHSAWLPVSIGDRTGDRLNAGLDAAVGEGERLLDLLCIS